MNPFLLTGTDIGKNIILLSEPVHRTFQFPDYSIISPSYYVFCFFALSNRNPNSKIRNRNLPVSPSFPRKQRSQLYRFNHGLGIGPALARLAECGSVIHRGPHDRKSQGNIDAGHFTPLTCFLIVLEAEKFHRDMSLIMIHDHHGIIHAAFHF